MFSGNFVEDCDVLPILVCFINPLTTNVHHHIETSQLICSDLFPYDGKFGVKSVYYFSKTLHLASFWCLYG